MSRLTVFHRTWRSGRAWLSSDEGASMVEYGVMLGLIVSIVLSATLFLGDSARSAFQRLSAGASMESVTKTTSAAVDPAASRRPAVASGLSVSLISLSLSLVSLVLMATRYVSHARRDRILDEPQPIDEAQTAEYERAVFAKRQMILKQLSSDSAKLNETGMLVRHVLTSMPNFVSPKTSADEVASEMARRHTRHLLVCQGGRVLGVISDRDVRGRSAKTAEQLMTRNPITVTPDTPVFQTISVMMTKRISCLPVVQDDQLVGILTTTDLMMALQCTVRILKQQHLDNVDTEERLVEVA